MRKKFKNRAAFILDEISSVNFSQDFHKHVHLNAKCCIDQMNEFKPEFMMVESAWFGHEGSWYKKISAPSSELQNLIIFCKKALIPTVFWCKEDPIHFDRFFLVASLFDFVFSTDINCISKYKRALGHQRVFLLPFACQNFTHNPIESAIRNKGASYAGSYYRRFPNRVLDTEKLINSVLSVMPLDVYDRYHNSSDSNYCYPEHLEYLVKGSLAINKIDMAYKGYQFSINLNTVKDSESMFARRVPELLGSGTITVSNNSLAFPFLFGDIIIASDDPNIIKSRLTELVGNSLLRAKLALAGVRKVMSEHTYAHRIARIIDKVLGVVEYPILPSVLVLFSVKTFVEAKSVYSMLLAQTFSQWQAICLVDSKVLLEKLSSSTLDSRIQVAFLGDLANIVTTNLVGENSWISIFDPDDYYGPNYLQDLVLATRYSKASAFGKKQFFQVVDADVVLQGSEGAYWPMTIMDFRSSLISADHFSSLSIAQLFCDDAISSLEVNDGMSLDYLGYCRNVFEQHLVSIKQVSLVVDDLEINQGSSIDELYAKADLLKMEMPFWLGKPGWKPERLAQIFGDRFTRDITGSVDRFGWHIISEMRDGDSCDLLSEFAIPIADLGGRAGTPFYLEAGVGLQMQLLVRFEESSGALIDETIYEINTQYQLISPVSCTHIRLGYRITSSGSSRITRLVLA